MLQARFCYATGTGNTARVVRLLASALEAAGWAVQAEEVRAGTELPCPCDLLVVAFPVLGFGAPRYLLDWMRRLPNGIGRAAVIAVGGSALMNGTVVEGHPGASLHQVHRALLRRGYRVTDHFLSYPENWTQVAPPPSTADSARLRSHADTGLVSLAQALSSETSGAGSRPGSPAFFPVAWLFQGFASRLLGKLYAADPACNGCGWCARECPAAAIVLSAGRPRWGLQCCACNRCINGCPRRAIQTTATRWALHGAGNVALAAAVLFLFPIPVAVAAWAAATALEVTVLDRVLWHLEGMRPLRGLLTWGLSKRWDRYAAP